MMSPMTMTTKADPFSVKANLAIIVRGDMRDLAAFAERVESIITEFRLVIVHKQASASRLWVQEGEADDHAPPHARA